VKTCKKCGKQFEPTHPKQEDCSETCLAFRFDDRVKKTRKLARIYAATMGYRSMGEVRYAAALKKSRLNFSYESDKIEYQYDPQKYVVDFTIPIGTHGEKIHIEYKGKLDGPTRRKMRAIKKSNPDVDLRIVFEKPNNKLYRGAKMRYWEWAERNGFKWYDVRNVGQLKRDVREETKNARKNSKATAKAKRSQAKGMVKPTTSE
jgi:hypothetical protein